MLPRWAQWGVSLLDITAAVLWCSIVGLVLAGYGAAVDHALERTSADLVIFGYVGGRALTLRRREG